MNLRPRFPILLFAALLLTVGALPATAAAASKHKPKPTKPNAAIASQIVALERTANTLSGEIATLTARAATLETTVHPEIVRAPAGSPTPAPGSTAGGDFTGSFPDPKLSPGTVGPLQLGEGSVGSAQIVDSSIRPAEIAPGAVGSGVIGTLSEEDLASAIAGGTIVRQAYRAGESGLFELGDDDEQTLTRVVLCPGRLISGGWKLVPGELGAEIMASVPAFIAGGQSSEHDWVISVHEQFTNTSIRNRLDTSGICIP
jgi:hypothetical protein